MLFGDNTNVKLATSTTDPDGDHKVNCDCNHDCNGQDECDEYIYGPYCVAAVKRYFEENKYHPSLRCAYQVYVAHNNRVLDFHLFNWHNKRAGMRQTEITKPPYCMQEGCLKYELFWVQWKIENGPEKDYCDAERERKERAKMNKLTRKEASYKYTYTGYEGK